MEHADEFETETDDEFVILGAEAARKQAEAQNAIAQASENGVSERKRKLDDKSASEDSPAKKMKKIELDDDDDLVIL